MPHSKLTYSRSWNFNSLETSELRLNWKCIEIAFKSCIRYSFRLLCIAHVCACASYVLALSELCIQSILSRWRNALVLVIQWNLSSATESEHSFGLRLRSSLRNIIRCRLRPTPFALCGCEKTTQHKLHEIFMTWGIWKDLLILSKLLKML